MKFTGKMHILILVTAACTRLSILPRVYASGRWSITLLHHTPYDVTPIHHTCVYPYKYEIHVHDTRVRILAAAAKRCYRSPDVPRQRTQTAGLLPLRRRSPPPPSATFVVCYFIRSVSCVSVTSAVLPTPLDAQRVQNTINNSKQTRSEETHRELQCTCPGSAPDSIAIIIVAKYIYFRYLEVRATPCSEIKLV